MRKYKQYSLLFLLVILVALFFHFTVWNVYTKHVFPVSNHIGDLGRLSYSLDNLIPRTDVTTLKKEHFNFKDWDEGKVDILTIGDSFSNGGAGGENSYYQDYLASSYNLRVLNIQSVNPAKNYLETIYLLNNIGLLEKINPNIIIVESTEHSVLDRFSGMNINTSLKADIVKVKALLEESQWGGDGSKKPNIKFINNLNLKALKYNIFYKYDDNAYGAACYITKTNKDLFSLIENKNLLFHKTTIKYNRSITPQKIDKLNSNLNNLAVTLNKKGIDLYFMPAVDKFNLYSKYVVNNKYGTSNFFELLRKKEKKYHFIDTKQILEVEVNKGVKDIFYADDTHWSYKASEAISKSLIEFKN